MEGRLFIGIDPAARGGLLTYAVLDEKRRLLKLAEGSLGDVMGEIGSYEKAVCAIDAPSGPNGGLMADPEYRAKLGLPPGSSRYAGYRVGEYELRRRGIRLRPVPDSPDKASGWVRLGWELYGALRKVGYTFFPGAGERIVAEVHAHASFTALLGHRPFGRQSLEGRVQRQLVLYDRCDGVPDPMVAFEEITRHRLLRGDLMLDGLLLRHDELDAVVAAYTAWLIGCEPGSVCAVGDPDEGLIVMPVPELRPKYDG